MGLPLLSRTATLTITSLVSTLKVTSCAGTVWKASRTAMRMPSGYFFMALHPEADRGADASHRSRRGGQPVGERVDHRPQPLNVHVVQKVIDAYVELQPLPLGQIDVARQLRVHAEQAGTRNGVAPGV